MASSFFTDDYIYKPKGGFSGDFGSSNYKYSSGDSTDKWKTALGLAANYLNNSSSQDKYRDMAQPFGSFGQSSSGGAQQLSNELSVVYPQQQAPFFVPGQEGKKGFGSTIGGILGTVGGALIGGPAGASIGGSIGSGAGSFFN